MTEAQAVTTGWECQCGGQLLVKVRMEALDGENINNGAKLVVALTCLDCSAIAEPEPWQWPTMETMAAAMIPDGWSVSPGQDPERSAMEQP